MYKNRHVGWAFGAVIGVFALAALEFGLKPFRAGAVIRGVRVVA